jgi:molybdopterin converting factor small subunit
MSNKSIKIHLHKTHRDAADGLEVVEVEGSTVGDCLNDLVLRFPGIKEKIYDRKGKLKNFIEIYLNMETAYPDELAKPVKAGDEIHLTILLAGG